MNLNRLFRLALLLLFALLQCVAPLTHAHVGGNNADQNVHFDIAASSWLHDHDTEVTHFSVEEHHSPVVSMPPEFRCGDLTFAPHMSTDGSPLIAPRKHIPLRFTALPQQDRSALPYQHPCSQAPPA